MATFGTRRMWIRRFIEDYVIAHGQFPMGEHRIDVQIGGSHYLGDFHDFSDLR
ncbi:MAG: hypothetical protein AB7V40_11055 [Methyloceanibacter sp.]